MFCKSNRSQSSASPSSTLQAFLVIFTHISSAPFLCACLNFRGPFAQIALRFLGRKRRSGDFGGALLRSGSLDAPFPSLVAMTETAQLTRPSLALPPYICFYGGCKRSAEINGNSVCADRKCPTDDGAWCDIVNCSLRECRDTEITMSISISNAGYLDTRKIKELFMKEELKKKFVVGSSPEQFTGSWPCTLIFSSSLWSHVQTASQNAIISPSRWKSDGSFSLV